MLSSMRAHAPGSFGRLVKHDVLPQVMSWLTALGAAEPADPQVR